MEYPKNFPIKKDEFPGLVISLLVDCMAAQRAMFAALLAEITDDDEEKLDRFNSVYAELYEQECQKIYAKIFLQNGSLDVEDILGDSPDLS